MYLNFIYQQLKIVRGFISRHAVKFSDRPLSKNIPPLIEISFVYLSVSVHLPLKLGFPLVSRNNAPENIRGLEYAPNSEPQD